jgi:hypothetical protein
VSAVTGLPLLALAGCVALVGACGRGVLSADGGGIGHVTGAGGPGALSGAGGPGAATGGPLDGRPRSVDILFMIDNSVATSSIHANLQTLGERLNQRLPVPVNVP